MAFFGLASAERSPVHEGRTDGNPLKLTPFVILHLSQKEVRGKQIVIHEM